MKLLVKALLRCAGVVGSLLISAPAWTQSAALPQVSDFFRRPLIASPRLSPDGKRIAMLVSIKDGRTELAVADTQTPQNRVVVARFDDGDVRDFQWVNDRRLVFRAIDYQAPLGEQFGAGLYAADVDGSGFTFLVGRGRNFESTGHVAIRPLRWNHVLSQTIRDGSDDVLVLRHNLHYRNEAGSTTPLRLNTRTRATKELIDDAPDNANGWVFDRAGLPHAVTSIDLQGHARVLRRKSGQRGWDEIASYNIFDPKADGFTPVAVDMDGTLIVSALRNDRERTSALYRLDTQAGKLDAKPFLALMGYDYNGTLTFDQPSRKLVAANYLSDAAGTAWLEPSLQALQDRVDALLTNTNNALTCGHACLDQARFVVTAVSDRQSPVYFLFDKTKQGKDSLSLIGASRPWLDSTAMAEQEVARFDSRDGLSIPVYYTKPRGKGPWPTVMLIHGGPYVRGSAWGWSADAQFLASRGYLVVEPEFRGSTGYGARLFLAGWKQWGLKMQDDITDATNWAVAKGLADPTQVVIAGASYGGYATMMGLVKEPNLYRAGINWVGVTDIDLMYSIDWSDFDGSTWQRYGMPRLVGDRVADKAQLDATSPLKRAAEITKPVLMAYGTKDLRVPLPHGTKMRDALKAAGKVDVEWVEYEEEGHGFLLEKNRVDFWSRVEKFLARHLK